MINLIIRLIECEPSTALKIPRDVRGSAIAMEAMVKFVGIGVGLGVGIGIICHFFQMFLIIAGVCFLALHYAEAYYRSRNA